MKEVFSAKSRENLRAAAILFEQEMFNACANRAYYAAMHAATAALADAGISLYRVSHDAIQASFSGQLIRRRKIYPGRFRSYLLDLQSVRDDADYKLVFVSEKEARRQLQKAQEYVEAIHQEIEKQ